MVLILLNGAFVAAEYGLVTSRRTRIRELEREGNRRARAVLRITADPPRFIAAMQLGVTLTSLAIGALGEPLFSHLFEPWLATVVAVILALLIITYLHVVIGELVPKGIALNNPERTALALSAPVRAFFTVMAPLVWLLQRSTEYVLGLLGQKPPGSEHEAHSEAELRMLLSSSAEQGEIARRGAGDALQGLRLRRQGGRGRDGAASRGDRDLGRPAARGGARGRPRLAVHALPGLPRVDRRDRRHPARARPRAGDARPRQQARSISRSSCARRRWCRRRRTSPRS